jgi:tRNA threonylcarbamoyl adenosine modification protein (Sua5/YciO/YrdC/YwlC family)
LPFQLKSGRFGGICPLIQTEILDALDPGTFADAIARAAALLREGETVAFPTETVYGLGAAALNPDAIAKVFAAKGRPADNPLIVHVASIDGLRRCGRLDVRGEALAAAFMPGPLTIVIPSDPAIPTLARAGLPTVALRIPAHPVAAALIEQAGPLVAPSANLSGRPSPTTADHVYHDLKGRIAAVIDGGPCSVGIESTVVDLSGERATILRPGVITAEEIERVLGEPLAAHTPSGETPRSPGMKYRHYAPSARVRLVIGAPPEPGEPREDRLILTTPRHHARFAGHHVRLLSERELYALFRDADARGMREIVIYAEPDELSTGLLDRIRKAGEGNSEF